MKVNTADGVDPPPVVHASHARFDEGGALWIPVKPNDDVLPLIERLDSPVRTILRDLGQ